MGRGKRKRERERERVPIYLFLTEGWVEHLLESRERGVVSPRWWEQGQEGLARTYWKME